MAVILDQANYVNGEDVEDMFVDWLNESFPVEIAGVKYGAADVLRTVDPFTFDDERVRFVAELFDSGRLTVECDFYRECAGCLNLFDTGLACECGDPDSHPVDCREGFAHIGCDDLEV